MVLMDQPQFDRLMLNVLSGMTLRRALEKEKTTPYQFAKALEQDPLKVTAYGHAKRLSAEMYADEIVEIADTELDPQVAANRIKARQWVASKLLPKIYGEKLQLDVTERIDPAALRAEALARLAQRPPRDLLHAVASQVLEHKGEPGEAPTDRTSEGMRNVFD